MNYIGQPTAVCVKIKKLGCETISGSDVQHFEVKEHSSDHTKEQSEGHIRHANSSNRAPLH